MKQLYLVRHAKSSWKSDHLNDHNRPLNNRGLRDAPFMAKKLLEDDIRPDIFISSTAKRAYSTAEIFFDLLSRPGMELRSERSLYHASSDQIWSEIFAIDNLHHHAMLFAHNPGITHFANLFDGPFIDNVPTCGILRLMSTADRWEDMDVQNTKRIQLIYPKMYK